MLRLANVVFLCFVLLPSAALAEGSVDTGADQGLDQGNFPGSTNDDEVKVDILDTSEQIRICSSDNGNTHGRDLNEVIVKSPSGVAYDLDITISKGFCTAAGTTDPFLLPADLDGPVDLEVGTWTVDFAGQDEDFSPEVNGQNTRYWDVTVLDEAGVQVDGSRVHSEYWQLTAHAFYTNPTFASFYPYVPLGVNGDYTFRIAMANVAGFRYQVFANRIGIDAYPSRSHSNNQAEFPGVFARPEYELYLGIPSIAQGPTLIPHIYDDADPGDHILPHFETEAGINALNEEQTDGDFVFEANIAGTYQIVVDTNGDGIYDSAVDRLIVGDAVVGLNRAPWDGLDADGDPLPDGEYSARIQLIVAETHFPIGDIEYASCQYAIDRNHTCSINGSGDCGIRIWGVDPGDGDDSVAIDNFYNDLDVDDDDVPDGATNLPLGDPAGSVDLPGDCDPLYPSAPHEWYDWQACVGGASPGSTCYSNNDCGGGTCEWVGLGDTTIIDTWAFGDVDAEVAIVVVGCDYAPEDQDSDGITGCLEAQDYGTDPLDPDTDGDGLLDGREVNDTGTDPLDPDTDGDLLLDGTEVDGENATDPLNPDTDGDGLQDGTEDRDRDGALDADEPNPNDADTDDDGAIDGDEPEPFADSDADGTIDVLDPDSDGDGLYDGTELGVTEPSPGTDTEAGFFVPDEDPETTTDPTDADTDDGGVSDGIEDTNHNGMVDVGERDPLEGEDDIPPEDAGPDAEAPRDAGVDSGPPVDAGYWDYTVEGGCAQRCGVGLPSDARGALPCLLVLALLVASRRRGE